MKTSIAIVDYGMGNLRSVYQALRKAAPEADVAIVEQPEAIRAADRVVLPGQGAMRDCMAHLGASGLQEAVMEAARDKPHAGRVRRRADAVRLERRKATRTRPRPVARQGACASSWKASCRTTARASRCRKWAGTACARRSRIRCGTASPTNAFFYFVHSYYVRAGQSGAYLGRNRVRRAVHVGGCAR